MFLHNGHTEKGALQYTDVHRCRLLMPGSKLLAHFVLTHSIQGCGKRFEYLSLTGIKVTVLLRTLMPAEGSSISNMVH